ncbi:hypothetical protein [Peribacillus frigoritolerans]|uniref:hypothetical protein n=1 Tax=Peribacillus frigoritolerans TaxID=450367 RepID=UPI0021AAFED7|nr:hypothetical protein [Peribacillus frigoritolerans]
MDKENIELLNELNKRVKLTGNYRVIASRKGLVLVLSVRFINIPDPKDDLVFTECWFYNIGKI